MTCAGWRKGRQGAILWCCMQPHAQDLPQAWNLSTSGNAVGISLEARAPLGHGHKGLQPEDHCGWLSATLVLFAHLSWDGGGEAL